MNKEAIRNKVVARLETLSSEEIVELVMFLVVCYSILTSLVGNFGNLLTTHSDAFGKAVEEESGVVNKFFTNFSDDKEEGVIAKE